MSFKSYEQDAVEQLHSITDFVRWGASQFMAAKLTFGHGTDNAVDEALFLTLHALYLKPGLSQELMATRLTIAERRAVFELFRRRVEEKQPLAYLTNEAWFCGLPFYVDERVLVPRSPISELIENQFSPWVEQDEVFSVLDMCTGSGCIAIACAEAFPDAHIDAVDLSPDALVVAKINVDTFGLEDQVELLESNLFEGLVGRKYDLIVSNPPYVDALDMAALTDEFKHEPEMGLAAGDDGLDIVVQMLAQAENYLTEHGTLVVEVGNSDLALMQRYPDVPFIWPDFERGGHGIFVLHAETLREYRKLFEHEASEYTS